MANEKDIEHRMTALEERSKSNTHRLDDMKKRQDDLDAIVGAVKVLSDREKRVEDDVKEIKSDVKELTGKSGKRWDAIVDKVLLTIIGAILMGILAKLGI